MGPFDDLFRIQYDDNDEEDMYFSPYFLFLFSFFLFLLFRSKYNDKDE